MILERSMTDDFLSNTYLVAAGPGGDAFFVDAGGPVEPLIAKADERGLDADPRPADPPPPRPRRGARRRARALAGRSRSSPTPPSASRGATGELSPATSSRSAA